MIYMVDHVYADPATEPAWHAWYAGYLRKLTSVPGIHTAQRFKAIGHTPSRYLAMYSIDSADVYASEAYKNIGGGGSQSVRFHFAYQLWTRNLFDALPRDDAKPAAAIHAPVVQEGQRLLVFDREEAPRTASRERGVLESRATWLVAVGLHMTTKYRAFVVLDAREAATAPLIEGCRIYEPFTPVIAGTTGSLR
jgi:hypothetical protein